MSDAQDTGYAPDRWEFDEEVTRVFGDMLDRSIPDYETMRGMVRDVGSAFVRGGTAVVDIGCSHGEALASLRDLPGLDAMWIGLEISDPMLAAARERFGEGIPDVEIRRHDLRGGYPPVGPVSLTLSVLTLMFVPINYRQRILAQAYEQTIPSGAFILVEKLLGEGPKIDDILQANYHRKKVDSGYTPDEVLRKRLSLEGVLVPLTASYNEDMLRRAGFREIDCFWRWGPFAAWVAVK